MKIWVAGGRGQVGSEFCRQAEVQGYTIHATDAEDVDITQADAVASCMAACQPDLIVNLAAYTAVDKAESDADLAQAVNATAVGLLAEQAAQAGIPLFHVSTDYVFSGDKTEPYTEDDEPSPCSVYGQTKLAGEELLVSALVAHRILRVSWVFGQDGHNFVKTMLRLGSEREVLKVVNDQFGAPTSAAAISRALLAWCEAYRQAPDNMTWGLFHLPSEPGVTWYDFACEIFTQAHALGLLKKLPQVLPVPSSEYPTPVKRPANSKLASRYDEMNHLADDWRVSLRAVLQALQKA